MDSDSIFMQMVYANFAWAIGTFAVISVPAFFIARWKLRKMKAEQIKQMKEQKKSGPRVIAFGVPKAESGHCPLCGQGWPLAGPLYEKDGKE